MRGRISAAAFATGRSREEWMAILSGEGAAGWTHKETVAWLATGTNLSNWWCQTVAAEFERAAGRRFTGRTADAGFQIGVRRTVAGGIGAIWSLLVSPPALRLWLGTDAVDLVPGAAYRTPEGISGEIRVVKPNDRLRFTRRKDGNGTSTVQIALGAAGPGRAAVTFHEEKLPDEQRREEMRRHWRDVAERFASLAAPSRGGRPGKRNRSGTCAPYRVPATGSGPSLRSGIGSIRNGRPRKSSQQGTL